MSAPLPELLRQRALIQEHLAWLDRKIAEATGAKPPPLPASKPAAPAPGTQPVAPAAKQSETAVIDEEADSILSKYQQQPANLQQDTRRGCLMFFIGGMVALTLLAAIIYILYARHLGRWW